MQAKEAMDRVMGYIDEGRQKINEGLKVNDMMKVEAGQKLIEFGREKQIEANKRLDEILEERDRIEAELFRLQDSKKLKKNNSDAFYSLTVHNFSDQILLFSLSNHSYVVWVMWEFCITQVTNS